jgi:hypothetical protein
VGCSSMGPLPTLRENSNVNVGSALSYNVKRLPTYASSD